MNRLFDWMSSHQVKLLVALFCSGFGATTLLAQGGAGLYAPEELRRHFQNEAEAYVIERNGESKPLTFKPQSVMHWQNTERSQRNNEVVWSAPLRISLENTLANQRPDADGTYFTFRAPQSIPSPEQLR